MRQPDDPGVDPAEPWEPFDARWVAFVGLILFFALCGVMMFATKAKAHSWYTGAKNPVTKAICCDDRDCHVLADDMWWREGGNYVVRWDNGKTYSIPIEQAAPSQDHQGRAAGCVWGGMLKCFFLPLSG